MRKLFSFVLLTAFLFTVEYSAAQDPFSLSNKSDSEKPITKDKSSQLVKSPKFWKQYIAKISKTQRKLRGDIARLSRDIQEHQSKRALALILFLAFLYGVIHSSGPGHGKIFILSYFLSEKPDIKKGLLLGNMLAFIHAGMAVLLVLIFHFIVEKFILQKVDDVSRVLQLISFGMITVIGAFLFFSRLWKNILRNKDKTTQLEAIRDKQALTLALSIGLVPCPGTVILLLFSLSLDALPLGIMLAFFMAAGMAVTITSVGIITIYLKKSSLRILDRKKKAKLALNYSLELVGAFIIMVLGGALFFMNL
ncbi:MAG: hypothetical protein P9X24_19465 [Candidatus Hatepunaea meridiana]|nr:hypothetical protein [Candidatus Hatepunaea meridiana]